MKMLTGMVTAFVGMMLTFGPTFANECSTAPCCIKEESKCCEKKCCFFEFFNFCKPKCCHEKRDCCHERKSCCKPKKSCHEHKKCCHERKQCCEAKCCTPEPYVVTCQPDVPCERCHHSHYYHPDLFGGYEKDSCCEMHYQFYSHDFDALDDECVDAPKHRHHIDPCGEYYYWRQ